VRFILDNHAIYSNEELENWTNREELTVEESYLINKYIQNRGNLVEAGTGGGRIALEIKKKYPQLDICAFDFVKEMIKSAKEKNENIKFLVEDASDLSIFKNESFEYAVYLQQIVSLVPFFLVPKVLDESCRILKKDGIVLFSFLHYEGRWFNPLLSFIVNCVRVARGEKWEIQKLPWLKLANKPNWKLFNKKQATTYWFHKKEIEEMLLNAGFQIVETTTAKEIQKHGAIGGLYIVCKK
jgi:ubiquinone/menaquinone biosynthesis C-methylase UbiE